jgi:hypothetical protein
MLYYLLFISNLVLKLLIAIFFFNFIFQFHPLEFDFYINFDPYFYNFYFLFSYYFSIKILFIKFDPQSFDYYLFYLK